MFGQNIDSATVRKAGNRFSDKIKERLVNGHICLLQAKPENRKIVTNTYILISVV